MTIDGESSALFTIFPGVLGRKVRARDDGCNLMDVSDAVRSREFKRRRLSTMENEVASAIACSAEGAPGVYMSEASSIDPEFRSTVLKGNVDCNSNQKFVNRNEILGSCYHWSPRPCRFRKVVATCSKVSSQKASMQSGLSQCPHANLLNKLLEEESDESTEPHEPKSDCLCGPDSVWEEGEDARDMLLQSGKMRARVNITQVSSDGDYLFDSAHGDVCQERNDMKGENIAEKQWKGEDIADRQPKQAGSELKYKSQMEEENFLPLMSKVGITRETANDDHITTGDELSVDYDDNFWEAARIIDKRLQDGVHVCKVRWKGRSEQFDSWEKEAQLVQPLDRNEV